MHWTLARSAEKMNPSVIREILKVTEQPGIISFAGGLPSPQTFPIDAMREASNRVLRQDGFIERHVPTIRALYKQQCAAMLSALDREMAGLGLTWNRPVGGMFLWVQLPKGMNAVALLAKAVDKGVAFVPGSAFYAAHEKGDANDNTLRLTFVTATVDQINTGMIALAAAIRESLPGR